MKIARSILAKSAIALSAFAALSTVVSAAVDDYTYTYSTTGLDTGFGAAIASMGVFVWVIACCGGLIGLILIVMNIWMLIDVLKRTESELPNKTTWMILLIIGLLVGFGWIPALIYFFGPRKSLKK